MPRSGAKGQKKSQAPAAYKLPEQFKSGEILSQTQPQKKKWQLGDVIGQGGFGLIYKASDVTDSEPSSDPPYVIKIEPLDNGPLFCEFHFYQRAAKPEFIAEWTQLRKLRYLGIPPLLGAGQHTKGGKHYRYLVMPRFSTDLQKVFVNAGRSFLEKTTYSIGLRMLDALEYIHDKGYAHADIKASNILLGYKNGNIDYNQVYLVDYGLAYRYMVDSTHKPYKEDPKRAHDGTAEYASRDAHKGVCPSRRGDLEILGYCMLEWLSGHLPWEKFINDKEKIKELKIKYMNDLQDLMQTCFGSQNKPEGLRKYLAVVSKLAYDEKPDYGQLRQLLKPGAGNEWSLALPTGETVSPQKGTKRKSDSYEPLQAKVAKTNSKADVTTPKLSSRKGRAPVANGKRASAKLHNASSEGSGPSGAKLKITILRKTFSSPAASVTTPRARKTPSKTQNGSTQTLGGAKVKASSSSITKRVTLKRKRLGNVNSLDSGVQTSPSLMTNDG
ncbi:serine/threonine-protein kinase VRK1-like isoform X2 [Pomacea canaliculata]|uniref:serine/threonine-protein kinase VRK1-like isoform X2 n=1 Tax=Pomacea canaliculata TaxID=400727 RepID=UPI000D73F912|nr:serine/threonine-protein kinase VRK1-like isoform X2 [Pomacea canaliculata]XP_025105213.1 serine/threonine-protein kinase VRK1-like isoform X2 [Pomacea canaliculata]